MILATAKRNENPCTLGGFSLWSYNLSMKLTLKITLYGYFLLILAIILNLISSITGLTNWYEFLKSDNLASYSYLDFLWLFIFYPLLLGLAVWLAMKVEEKTQNFFNTKTAIIFLASFFIILASIVLVLYNQQKINVKNINSFEECQDAGYPIAEIFPEQCYLPDGRSFTKDDGVACTMDAKECPDGSFVGRVPPNCEFTPCPGEQ